LTAAAAAAVITTQVFSLRSKLDNILSVY